MSRTLVAIGVLALPGLAGAFEGAGGILVVGDYAGQADEFARVIEFKSVHWYPMTARIERVRGGSVSMFRARVRKVVAYPRTGGELLDESAHRQLEGVGRELGATLKRFPRTRPYLEPRLTEVERMLSLWDQGYARVAGRWVDRDDYLMERDLERVRAKYRSPLENYGRRLQRDDELASAQVRERKAKRAAMFRAAHRHLLKQRHRMERIRRTEDSEVSGESALDSDAKLDTNLKLGERRR